MNELEQRFHRTMLELYEKARDEADYNATRFLSMLSEIGGLETARVLLHASSVSDGYVELWKRGRLDLAVEAVILRPEWDALFSVEERLIAQKRLRKYKESPPPRQGR